MDELAASIAERGVLQPIIVRAVDDGYELVAGERRWRAAQKAQLHEIPAIIREFDEESSAEVALIENIQREDLNAIEEAEAYRQLISRYGHSQEVVGKLVGKSRSHVANLLRLLELPDPVRLMLLRGDISMGHARAIATAPDPGSAGPADRRRRPVGPPGRASGEEGPARAGARHRPRLSAQCPRPVDADLAALERQLSDLLGLRVKVSHGKSGGTVALHYSTLDQLDLICQRSQRRADLAAAARRPRQRRPASRPAPPRPPAGAA